MDESKNKTLALQQTEVSKIMTQLKICVRILFLLLYTTDYVWECV